MKRKFVLHSALAPDAVDAALRRSVDEERRTLFSFSGYKGDLPVLCKFGENGFRLQKRKYHRNDFSPYFFAKFEPEPGGTRIEGYFDMAAWPKLFMRIWLGGVVLIGGPLWVMSILDVLTGSHNTQGEAWIGIVIPPTMIIFGVLFPRFGGLMGRGEERFLMEFLQNTLMARIEDSDNEIQLQSSR